MITLLLCPRCVAFNAIGNSFVYWEDITSIVSSVKKSVTIQYVTINSRCLCSKTQNKSKHRFKVPLKRRTSLTAKTGIEKTLVF